MATAINPNERISLESYIHRFVLGNEKPTCEYIDGMLEQKSLATKKHGQVQANIIVWIRANFKEIYNPLPELSTHVSATRFYIPDLAVEDTARPITERYPGPNDPVPLCVEILSPPDLKGKLFSKCKEYHRWGVSYCWIIDPETEQAWEYHRGSESPQEVREMITAGPIEIPFSALFEMD